MINYSIIIPTHNRHNLMQKNIEYFSSFKNCQIYICDSTDDKYNGKFPQNMTYVHMPQKSFVQKMNLMLQDIETDYVAVCADDDFIVEDTTNEILQKLKTENYVMGVGKYCGFDIPFGGFFEAYSKQPIVNNKFSIARVVSYLSNYYMSLWAVYKTHTIQKAYKVLEKSNFSNHNFIELTIAIICAIEGKIFFSEKLYGVREFETINQSWRHQHINLLRALKNNSKDTLLQVYNLAKKSEHFRLYSIGCIFYILSLIINTIKAKLFKKTFIRKYLITQESIFQDIKAILMKYEC